MKTVILVQWKHSQIKECFTSLKVFVRKFTRFNYHTIDSYIGRKKVAYEDEEVILERLPLHSPILGTGPSWVQRKYVINFSQQDYLKAQKKMKEQDETKDDIILLNVDYDVITGKATIVDKITCR